ncbi:zinc finger, CCHC-type containing protein [Tanacetum coccineum]
MWNLRRITELRDLAQSNNWSDVLSLYFWRSKDADLRMARMINNVSVKLRAVIEEYQLFTQELEASPGWVVNKDRSIEYLQELVQRDEKMVQRLQALKREVKEMADEKMLFIEKLKGNLTHTGGLSAALEDPEEELAREEEFEGVVGPEKELAFSKEDLSVYDAKTVPSARQTNGRRKANRATASSTVEVSSSDQFEGANGAGASSEREAAKGLSNAHENAHTNVHDYTQSSNFVLLSRIKCWFKDVWKRNNQTSEDGWDEFYSLKEKMKFLLTAFKVYYVLEGPPVVGVMTERNKGSSEQVKRYDRGYILRYLMAVEETRIREKNLNGASSSKVNYVDSGKNNKGNNKKRKGTAHASVTTTDDWLLMILETWRSSYIEKKLTLMNVIHVPNIRTNLISGYKLCKSRVKAVIELDKVILFKANVFVGKGLIHQRTSPYTPQQNGVAERKNRVLQDMINAIPDIAYAVCKLSRYTSNQSQDHWKAIGRIFGYLKRTRQLALYYDRFPVVLEGYSDASWEAGGRRRRNGGDGSARGRGRRWGRLRRGEEGAGVGLKQARVGGNKKRMVDGGGEEVKASSKRVTREGWGSGKGGVGGQSERRRRTGGTREGV